MIVHAQGAQKALPRSRRNPARTSLAHPVRKDIRGIVKEGAEQESPALSSMEQEESEKTVTSNPGQEGGEGGSMYVAVIDEAGEVRDVTPITREALSAVQETLRNLHAVPIPTKRSSRAAPFPPVTSQHVTPLPGTESFLVLTGSFGPNVSTQPSLWTEGQGFDLTTPTGKLRIQGQSTRENTSLQHYVTRELGPEGLKELAGLLDVYHLLTNGRDQALNVEVTAKQVLQRLGKGEHANDRDEQAHLASTAIYLARSIVVSLSPKQTRITPLLVLEHISTDSDGTNPRLKYHLGEETFESIYGPKPLLYPLPTSRLIGYHGFRSHHEIMLTMYLGNRLAQGEGYSLYFVTLCTRSGLLSHERLLPAQKNRMRDAQQVISALVQLERDEFIRCHEHGDFDMVLAANVCLDPAYKDLLAAQTVERIQPQLRLLKGCKKPEVTGKRRAALQRLLDIEASREEQAWENPEFCARLTIYPGTQFLTKQKQLLEKQEGS